MRILFILTYLYNRGGDSRHALALADELSMRGTGVSFFGMKSSSNLPGLEGPFAPEVDYRKLLARGAAGRVGKAFRSISSRPARIAAGEFIEKHGPFDLAHVHSIHHQLSLSVMDELRARRIPVVWTLHDYKLICPNTSLFNDRTGLACTSLGKGAPLCVAAGRCKKGSLPASILTFLESGYNSLRGIYNHPAVYIVPSNFLGDLILRRNVTRRPVLRLRNFSPFSAVTKPEPPGSNFLYAGRLSKGKGLDLLIRAYSTIFDKTEGNLIVVGDGPEGHEFRKLASGLIPEGRYLFTGNIDSREAISEYYTKSRCLVLPSVWIENQPLTILEAFSHGRPVIGSNVGGIPEIVVDGKTGKLVAPGDVDGLSGAMMQYSSDIDAATRDGMNGLEMIRNDLNRESYTDKITGIYHRILAGNEDWNDLAGTSHDGNGILADE